MAQDNATPSTPVSTADVTNASALVESVSVIRQALSASSDAVVTAVTAVATAVTQKVLGGVVGTTTNRLLKAKTVSSGSSAGSLQASGITCDGSDNLTAVGSVAVVTGGGFKTATLAGNTALLQAYDVDGAAYVTFATLTANNTPTLDFAAATTAGGNTIVSQGDAATQTQQEAAASTAVFVTPGRQQFHPSASKVWLSAHYAIGVPTTDQSYNVTSLTDTATGQITVNFITAFSGTTYAGIAGAKQATSNNDISQYLDTFATGHVLVNLIEATVSADSTPVWVALWGDQ